jgi:hypothetical protein
VTYPIQGTAVTNATNTTQTVSFPVNVTTGNFILLAFRYGSITATITSVTDNLGNTYTQRLTQVASVTSALYTAPITTGGACTVTVVLSATATMSLAVEEYYGTTTSIDGTPASANGASTTPASGATTTTTAGSMLIGYLIQGVATITGESTNFTLRQVSGTAVSLHDQISAPAGSYNHQPTLSSGVVWHSGILGLGQSVPFAQPSKMLTGVGM